MAALSLVPALISPDIFEVSLRFRKPVPADRSLSRIYDALMGGPLRAAEVAGFSIGSHSAQMWPPGWPPWLARDAKMCLIFIPFWFVVGVPLIEAFLWLSRGRRSRSEKSRA